MFCSVVDSQIMWLRLRNVWFDKTRKGSTRGNLHFYQSFNIEVLVDDFVQKAQNESILGLFSLFLQTIAEYCVCWITISFDPVYKARKDVSTHASRCRRQNWGWQLVFPRQCFSLGLIYCLARCRTSTLLVVKSQDCADRWRVGVCERMMMGRNWNKC